MPYDTSPMTDDRRFDASQALSDRFHAAIPGGGHTYAKGDDQYPEDAAPIIARGRGCRVWDVDGNEFIEYGSGLRAVTLGHAYEPVNEAVCQQVRNGTNFVRPSLIELECAEEFLACVAGAEMVKFAKNGSDVTTAAVKLARAFTGRDTIAICGDQPFLSTDDWFIGTTAMNAGIPARDRALTVKFRYNDLASVDQLFADHPGQIACVVMEAEAVTPPSDGFLEGVQVRCRREGALLVFDEMITGFRWHIGGAQAFHSVVPDLSAFGKALGNGFSVSALAGRREVMERGGLRHDRERVFLLSTTHGAETHGLAAARAVMQAYRQEHVIDTLWRQGQRLADGVGRVVAALGLQGFFDVMGRPCNLVYATRDQQRQPSQGFRTLFLREMIRRGVLAPSFVVNAAHGDADIDTTIDRVGEALVVYKRALDEGLGHYLSGRPVRPVFRAFN
jgi:glutamate-1-semialdehyde 2,1-aminomutase